jgi:hypothetical protein
MLSVKKMTPVTVSRVIRVCASYGCCTLGSGGGQLNAMLSRYSTDKEDGQGQLLPARLISFSFFEKQISAFLSSTVPAFPIVSAIIHRRKKQKASPSCLRFF